MRLFLIVLCLFAMIATGWHAAFKGTEQDRMLGAPQVQNIVEASVQAALQATSEHPLVVDTDGRNVVISGTVNSEAERSQVLAEVAKSRLVARIIDELEVLRQVSPYTLTVSKAADGSFAVSGHAPSRVAEDVLLAAAKVAASGAEISADLTIAAGAPEGDWSGMVGSGITALSALQEGTLEFYDLNASLSGLAENAAAAEVASGAIAAAPMGEWQADIEGAPPEGGFVFTALKAPDGAVIVDGHAPDVATQGNIMTAASEHSSAPVGGDLEIATGMPDAEWPNRVTAGLNALGAMSTGLLRVEGKTVSLSGEVETDADLAVLQQRLQPGWGSEISVANPTPVGDIRISQADDGVPVIAGFLPDGVTAELVAAALPGADLSGIDGSKSGKAADWTGPLEGLSIVLPRFVNAKSRVVGQKMTLSGTLNRGYSTEGVEASLRTVLSRDWQLVLDIDERPPLAELVFSKRGEEIVLSGVLPMGISPEDALHVFGDTASGEGLASGGEGDSVNWASGLTETSGALTLFSDVTGRIAEQSLELNGVLLPGYSGQDVQRWLDTKMPDGWRAGLAADISEPGEGDRRTNLESGEPENFRRGYWLPDVQFPVSSARCRSEIDGVLRAEEIVFVTGSADIDARGRSLLNRLAAISVRCLNSSVFKLEIAGHTDSVGNDASNLTLSQERADAVMNALIARGVRAESVSAVGYGETQPIASNDTAEGRAENRRIAFSWSDDNG